MGRNRVLSFMSQFSATGSRNPTPSSSPPSDSPPLKPELNPQFPSHNHHQNRPITPPFVPDYAVNPDNQSPAHSRSLSASGSPPHRRQRSSSRPLSMVQTYQPPLMDVEDTIPELQPIFSFLNSHSNKLYQEGYFLKLDDQNTQGRPNPDRTWTECFAQLVGTVLSLWDAAELDAAGEDGEVLPKFINLTDASIKMIESLPTRSNEEQPLQNILSISTAGRNRYLLHFNSHHSLVQWTAGIRLAMFEHNTLQEAYTGALIAGKGKTVNNINVIMERSRFKTEEWVRVRFGAGVPWRRCWCVISPPDEKEYAKLQKELKKRSPYDRSPVPVLKGDIKFYDTRKDGKKQKKAQPIASITDAHAAYAIYPQAKSLVDASTLLKIEGHVTIHSDPPSSTEGFVFIMPEVRPAVTGFEMLLRFLFPTWDTFGLYGRPGRLIASTLDSRSLMFAMPKHKRYGYLEILDVTTLITEDGSAGWNEKDWRKRLKDVTGTRMNAMEDGSRSHSRSDSRRSARLSYGGGGGSPTKGKVGFAQEQPGTRSSRSFSLSGGQRTDPDPNVVGRPGPSMGGAQPQHARNSSDPSIMASAPPSRNEYGGNPNPYSTAPQQNQLPLRGILQDRMTGNDTRNSSDDERGPTPPGHDFNGMGRMQTPEPVQRPPAFNHTNSAAGQQKNKAYHSPALRRANSRLSSTTLAQLAKAGGVALPSEANREESPYGRYSEDTRTGPSVQPQHAAPGGMSANDNRSREAMSPPGQGQGRPGPAYPAPLNIPNQPSRGPSPGNAPPSPYGQHSPAFPPQEGSRSPYPAGQGPPHGGMPQGRPQHPDARGPPPPGYRPGPGPRPGTSASERSVGASHRKPLPDRTGPAPYGGGGPVDTDDILDSYGDDPGPARQHPYRGPPSDRTGAGPPPGAQGNYGPYGGDGSGPERQRAGVLKTVGGNDGPPQPQDRIDIPEINFGPTINYGAPPRKPAPGGPPMPPHAQAQRPYSPAGQRPHDAPPRSPRLPDHEEPRSMPWKPAGMSPGAGQHGVSPEQYVQQRAAASPQYPHVRSPSGEAMAEAQAARPQHARRRSSFSMLHDGRARSNENVHRPSTSQGEGGSHMSARDQEHMARMTGQPLLNVGGGQRPSPGGQPGLVGHIDSRERERQQMRQGANQQAAQAAQQAMATRQQQQAAMHQQMMMAERNMSPMPSPGYGPPQSFSRPMASPPPSQSDPRFMPPQGQYHGQQQGPPSGAHPHYQGQAF